MKKFSIYLLGALALAATSCDEAPEVPAMQANPQPAILADGDIKGAVEGVLAGTATVALETAGTNVPVFAFTEVKDLPEGATLRPEFELSNAADFSRVETLEMTLSADGETYTVSDDAWNTAHLALFGKSPKVKTAYYRIPVYVTYEGTEYRYNSTDWYAAQGTVTETCKDAGFVIYDAYYFLSDATTWDFGATDLDSFKFDHSSADVYDDPVFTYVLEITEDVLAAKNGAIYWKIASQGAIDANDWNLVYGPEVDGDDNLAGMLVGDGAAQAGKIIEAGKYRVKINMEEMTYEFELITRPDYVAVPSNANGWNESGPRLYYVESKNYFAGAAVVNNTDGGFKFIIDGAWYGESEPGHISTAASGNIVAPEAGNQLYWFTVNTDDMTYTMTAVTSIGLIGDFNSWGAQEPLTPDASLLVWTGDFNLSGTWKIRLNDNWDFNWGGTPDDLVVDGGNIGGFDGAYTVTLDMSGNKPVLTLTAK